jgi:TRAP-type C4-dicarboxylate transport system permease small subunit
MLLQFTLLLIAVAALAAVRAWHLARSSRQGFFLFWGRLEIAAVTLLIGALVVFGVLQIILRNFFQQGIIWADPLMRHIVLWLGCLGGTLASVRMRHINIDVLSRILPPRARQVRNRIVFGATAIASTALGLAALRLVIEERTYGARSFLNIQTWILESILPAAFLIIAYRGAYNAMLPEKHEEEPR